MFEIDPITGLPIIDPTTGKPKIKQPTFKSNKEAKAYFEQDKQNKFDQLLGVMGLSQNPLEQAVIQKAEADRFEQETGLSAADYFNMPVTPGDLESVQQPEFTSRLEDIEMMELLEEKTGMAPMVGSDYEDLLAEQQTVGEQWANGTLKFVGKTALNVAGTLGNVVASIPALIEDFSLKSIYDNDYMNFMSEVEKDLESALPNYVRREVEDYSLLGQIGTANFWANDVLGGMSFVTGAILSEMATAGLATHLQLANAAKALKFASKADDILGAGKTIGILKGVDEAGRFGRQLVTGSFYEAGLEANHFVKDAKDKFTADFIRMNGREPDEMETALAMQDIYNSANYVFGLNAALVSMSNMATLPQTFGSKLSSRIAPKLDEAAGKVVKYSDLGPDDIKKLAKKRGVEVDDLTKEINANPNKTLSAFELYSKPQNILNYTKNFVTGPGAEMFEELGQSVISDTALEHVASKWDEDGTKETAGVAEALSTVLAESAGDKEFWKEGIIGLIIGLTGGPNIGRKKGESIWQGGFMELGGRKERANVESLVNRLNSSKDLTPLTKEMVIAGVKNAKAVKELDQASALGDMFRAKNKENEIFHNTAAAWHRAGRIEDFQKASVEAVEKMTDEEFRNAFEYTNMDLSLIHI